MLQKGGLLVLLLGHLLSPVFRAGAQEKSACFRGSINDFSEHQGIPFAVIFIRETRQILYSDSLGEFRICPVPVEKLHLVIRQTGFDSLVVSLEPGKKKASFHLRIKDHWLDPIDVQGIHRHFESEVSESQTLSKQELDRSRGLSLGELLTRMPGIQSLQSGPSIFKPVIQGLTGQRIAVVSQGVKLEGQQWGFDHAPEIDPNLADEITVVKGAQAVRYGAEAIGGTILIEPGRIETEGKWQGRVGLGYSSNGRGFFQNGMLQKSFGRAHQFAFRASCTYRRSGDFSTARYVMGNTAMEEAGSQLLFRYHGKRWKAELSGESFFTRLGIFAGSHISTPEGIRNAVSRPDSTYNYRFSYQINRPSQEILHLTVRAKAEYHANEKHHFQLLYNQQLDQRKEFDVIRRSSRCPECPQLQFELYSGQWEFNHKYLSGQKEVKTGLVGLLQSNQAAGSILVPDFLIQQFAAYHIHSWYRGLWSFETGVRAEFRHQQVFQYFSLQKDISLRRYVNVMANAGMRYQMADHWHSKINLQLSSRAPHVNESYSNGVHHGTASFEQGDNNLRPEKILNISYSIHHRSEKWEFLANLFETYSRGFIYLSPVKDSIVYTIRGPFAFFRYAASEVNMRGVDASLYFEPVSGLRLYSQISLIRSWNLSEKNWLIFQPADRYEAGWEFETKNRNSGLQFRLRLGPQYIARQIRVPEGRDFAPPPSAYWLWNARMGISGRLGRREFDFSVEGQNLLNASYRDYLNRFRYFVLDPGRNIRFRLTVRF